MARIPPTTTYQIEQPDESPCCGAPLSLSSPPLGYECRECLETFTLPVEDDAADSEDDQPGDNVDEDADESATCPKIIASGEREGEVCGRDMPCRFHGPAAED